MYYDKGICDPQLTGAPPLVTAGLQYLRPSLRDQQSACIMLHVSCSSEHGNVLGISSLPCMYYKQNGISDLQ